MDLVFPRGEFLSLFWAQNESLRLIIIYYIEIHIWDHNNFARFTSEPKKSIQRLDLGKTSYEDIVFARSDFDKACLSSKRVCKTYYNILDVQKLI